MTNFPATCTACGEYWEHEDGRGPTGPCREDENGTHSWPEGERTASTAWVCTDCSFAEAGCSEEELGYKPDRQPLTLLAEHSTSAGLMPAEHASDCVVFLTGDWQHECECAHDSFSMQDCEGCGSRLAGDRYALTVW